MVAAYFQLSKPGLSSWSDECDAQFCERGRRISFKPGITGVLRHMQFLPFSFYLINCTRRSFCNVKSVGEKQTEFVVRFDAFCKDQRNDIVGLYIYIYIPLTQLELCITLRGVLCQVKVSLTA